MPSIYSHGNSNVSKIWFVVLFSFVMMLSVVWKLFSGLEEIALHSGMMSQEINELMNDPR
ncbi:MAG: hypothetical protein KBD16_02565 [Candidatus Pacebacteria bacterium]|nr:hypothetical protein [Candidatus Paceibacterota bacterium]